MRRRLLSMLFALASTAAAQQYPFIPVANSLRNIFFRAYGGTYLIFWFVQRDRQPQRQRRTLSSRYNYGRAGRSFPDIHRFG
jgi:hypothetical protein